MTEKHGTTARARFRRAAAHLAPLTLLACAMSSSSTTPAPASPAAASTTPGRWVEGTQGEGAAARPWRLYLPRGHDARGRAPLVVLLHGCTQDAADVARGARVERHADATGALVLLPEQTTAAHPRRCWNWYDPAHQGREAGEPAIIAAATRATIAAHGVDAARVTVAGISAGGAMALIAGAAHPDLFAAVGVHSAIAPGAATTVAEAVGAMQGGAEDTARVSGDALVRAMGPRARPLPLIVFQGAADRIVHPRNAEQVVAQFAAAHARLGGAGGTVRDTTFTANGRSVRRVVQAGGAIEWWTVDSLGHAWSGGAPEGTFTDAAGPDATAEIFRFLLSRRIGEAKESNIRDSKGSAEGKE